MWIRNVLRAAAVVGAVVGVHYLCVWPYRAERVLDTVKERTALAPTLDRSRTSILARANLADLAQIETPKRLDPSWYLLYGTNCELAARSADAEAVYSRALLIDQRPEIYVDRGMIRLQLGRIDGAVGDLAIAARFDPAVMLDLEGDLRARVAAAAGIH